MTSSSVDITIPVLDEERTIVATLATLTSYLSTRCPYDWSITVADNGSTDQTFELASAFARVHTRTRVIRLAERGRGRALKEAWSTSTADVVAYMDVDLSTGLESLQPLVDPIVEGRCDICIGSRLAPGAETARSLQREVISRGYNVIARSSLGYGILDAQCGFKAMRASLARRLIPSIEDNGWFFDTELLVKAHRSGMRITEVPVRWVEDDDSRVRILRTAVDDLKGIVRLWRDGRRNPTGRAPGAGDGRRDSSDPTAAPTAAPAAARTAGFGAHAAGYEDAVDRSVSFTGRDAAFFARRKVEILEEIVRPGLGPLQGLSVLDVGCGTGTTGRVLLPRVRSLQGVDISEEMLAQARRNLPDAAFSCYDGETLPFADETFDVAVAVCVLHHVPVTKRFKVVTEMVRVTRPGGVIAVFEHNPYNPLTRHAVHSCDLDHDAVLLRCREALELLRASADAEPGRRHYLFSALGGAAGRSLDRHLQSIPLGGQYTAWVRRPGPASHHPTVQVRTHGRQPAGQGRVL